MKTVITAIFLIATQISHAMDPDNLDPLFGPQHILLIHNDNDDYLDFNNNAPITGHKRMHEKISSTSIAQNALNAATPHTFHQQVSNNNNNDHDDDDDDNDNDEVSNEARNAAQTSKTIFHCTFKGCAFSSAIKAISHGIREYTPVKNHSNVHSRAALLALLIKAISQGIREYTPVKNHSNVHSMAAVLALLIQAISQGIRPNTPAKNHTNVHSRAAFLAPRIKTLSNSI